MLQHLSGFLGGLNSPFQGVTYLDYENQVGANWSLKKLFGYFKVFHFSDHSVHAVFAHY